MCVVGPVFGASLYHSNHNFVHITISDLMIFIF